jgi:hypothetical protein
MDSLEVSEGGPVWKKSGDAPSVVTRTTECLSEGCGGGGTRPSVATGCCCLLIFLGLTGLATFGLFELAFLWFSTSPSGQEGAIITFLLVVILVGLAAPVVGLMCGLFKCVATEKVPATCRCGAVTLPELNMLVCVGIALGVFTLLYGTGFPLVLRGLEFEFFQRSTAFDASFESIVDKKLFDSKLGFRFSDSVKIVRNASFIGTARKEVGCTYPAGRSLVNGKCKVVACVTPVMDTSSDSFWRPGIAARQVLFYATCFLPDEFAASANLAAECHARCGEREDMFVGQARSMTYARQDGHSPLDPYLVGVAWDFPTPQVTFRIGLMLFSVTNARSAT